MAHQENTQANALILAQCDDCRAPFFLPEAPTSADEVYCDECEIAIAEAETPHELRGYPHVFLSQKATGIANALRHAADELEAVASSCHEYRIGALRREVRALVVDATAGVLKDSW